MKLQVVVEPDEDVFVAYCPELPGCVTYADTEGEALRQIEEAIELYLRPVPSRRLAPEARVYEVAV